MKSNQRTKVNKHTNENYKKTPQNTKVSIKSLFMTYFKTNYKIHLKRDKNFNFRS